MSQLRNGILICVASFIMLSCNQKKSSHSVTGTEDQTQHSDIAKLSSPEEAKAELIAGNMRFVQNKLINTNYEAQIEASKEHQKPHSVILSCMDSRVPPEIIFDQGIGNVFAIRVAGNVEDENVLGSLEYAVKFAGSKLIVVLGHSHCGAVKGAIKDVDAGNLTQLVNQIKPCIPEDRSVAHLDDETAKINVTKTIIDIIERSEIVKELVHTNQISIVGAFYDIETGEVVFID
jgi:carbonic anhydrase